MVFNENGGSYYYCECYYYCEWHELWHLIFFLKKRQVFYDTNGGTSSANGMDDHVKNENLRALVSIDVVLESTIKSPLENERKSTKH